MALEDLGPGEVLRRAYSRAVPPAKAIRLVQAAGRRRGLSEEQFQVELRDALLQHFVRASQPSNLFTAYLTEALSTGTLDSQGLVTQLLFDCRNDSLPSKPSLLAICAALLGTAWGISTLIPVPAILTDPRRSTAPDIGTSASATSGESVSTVTLLLPLLRLATNVSDLPPMPILALIVRLLSALQPYPAPPLEVGIEASAMLPLLPEAIAVPLRNALGGLMADLTISQTAAALNINSVSAEQGGEVQDQQDFPPLPPVFAPPAIARPIPSSQMVSFLLTYTLDSAKHATVVPNPASSITVQPWTTHITLLRTGRYFTSPEEFLLALLEGSLQLLFGTHQTITPELSRAMLWVTEWLPSLLRYWKDTSRSEWDYPTTLAESLTTTFEAAAANLTSLNTWISSMYAGRLSEAESDEDTGGFSLPEGWLIENVQTSLIRRLVSLNLLDVNAAQVILPGIIIQAEAGESLMNRVAEASRSALPVYEAIVAVSPGAARSFATDILAALSAYPTAPLPDNLLTNISSRPSLLIASCCNMPPSTLLALCKSSLLETPTDDAARADDPQGVLTRFGEGVVFVEAVVDAFELDMPVLLVEARSAVSLGYLDGAEKACLTGWVKALFSSEGIDESLMQSTMPRDLYRLAPSIIYQAVAATAAAQLDRDALLGGLSYFSQPLLSWCLGSIICWLCNEIVRNGLISTVHLDVLQIILTSDSLPDVAIRINAKKLYHLLDPALGMGPVFSTANFDLQAIKTKLDGVAAGITGINTSPQTLLPLNIFRSQLSIIRHLNLTQQSWSAPFLADIQDCLSTEGPLRMIELIVEELSHPSLEFDRTNGDPLAYLAPLLCAISLDDHRPFIVDLISVYLPRLVDGTATSSGSTDIYNLCGLVKASLLLFDWTNSSTSMSSTSISADQIAQDLIEDLNGFWAGQSNKSEDVQRTKRPRKRKGAIRVSAQLGEQGVANLQTMRKVLGSDEELRSRWPDLRGLGTR